MHCQHVVCAGNKDVHEVRQRQRAGSYASDYLPIWAGLAECPEEAVAGLGSMQSAGSCYPFCLRFRFLISRSEEMVGL